MSYLILTPEMIFSIQQMLEVSIVDLSVELAASIDHGSCKEEVMEDINELNAIKHYFHTINILDFDAYEAEHLWNRAAKISNLTYKDLINNWNQTIQCN